MERVHMQLAQLTHALGNLHLVAGVGETPGPSTGPLRHQPLFLLLWNLAVLIPGEDQG